MDTVAYMKQHMIKMSAIQGGSSHPKDDVDFFKLFEQAFGISPNDLPKGFAEGFRGGNKA